jgi:putative ABC transport system substrate-binding protein
MANSGSRIVGLEPIRNTACSQGAGVNVGFLPAPSSLLLALGALLFALCLSAEAQQAKKIPRIGYVAGASPANPGREVTAFQQGLRDLGYTEGKNILVEYRYQEGKPERGPILVAELVKLKVDALVIVPSPAIRAAKRATQTIPIIVVTTADPVAGGLVQSLARPGGNITGLTRITRDLNGKRLELLKEVVPTASRVGVLFQAGSTSGDIHFKEYETEARALKIELQSLGVRGQNPDFEGAFQTAAKGRVSALITITNSLTSFYRKQISDLAIKNRLPSMYETGDYTDAGGLMSYSANEVEQYKRGAVYVDKILKGAKPADLPVEQPTKFELVINLKTAKEIGLTIPPSVLARADRVIR